MECLFATQKKESILQTEYKLNLALTFGMNVSVLQLSCQFVGLRMSGIPGIEFGQSCGWDSFQHLLGEDSQ